MRRVRGPLLLGTLLAALLAAGLISAGIGQLEVPPDEVFGAVLHWLGLDIGPLPTHPRGEATLLHVRFPRVVLAIIVGAALATSGALLQGVFANPLAEPAIIGVSNGAAVGACVAIVSFGGAAGSVAGGPLVAAAAFLGGLVTTVLVYLLARREGRTEVVTLVLTGVAINAVAGGIIAYFLFVADPTAQDQIVFWQLGSLSGATWDAVAIVGPLAAIGIAAAILLSRRLDLLALGEDAARHLGVNVERLRQGVIAVVALLVASGVAFSGIIAFVGLVVPHLLRMIAGPGHRLLVPASALAGALVLVVSDLGARTLIDNAELPLGMLTSLVGGPFFFWLLRRGRAGAGGWS